MPFSYGLAYNTGIWAPAASGTTQVWAPSSTWGWERISQVTNGYVTFKRLTQTNCDPPAQGTFKLWNSFVYHDRSGTLHPFAGAVTYATGACAGGGTTISAVATDGSGLTLAASAPSGTLITSIVDSSGNLIKPATVSGAILTDPNGNQISMSVSGSNTSIYDTLSSTTAVLTITGSGTPSSDRVFTYTGPQGARNYNVKYTNYSVRTNFGCSNIGEYTSSTQVPLVSSIVLPDGTSYSFTYEPTSGVSGNVTGRLHSVTVPTGGTFTYQYGSVNCSTGGPSSLTRATPDGTWTYTASGSTTTKTDPLNNQTRYQFNGIYETKRETYQGVISPGNLLRTVDTCYNACGTGAITLPITQVTTTTTLPGANPLVSKIVTRFNNYGLPTEVDEYDFGASSPARKTITSYNTSLNSSNGPIPDRPASVTVQDGSGNTGAQTLFRYDETPLTATSATPQHVTVTGSHGNLTTVQRMNGSSSLTTKYSYFDAGLVYQFTDSNNAVTNFTYGNCGNSFLSATTYPTVGSIALSTSEVWNCTGAVVTSMTDANGKVSSATYNDANYWVPKQTTDGASVSTALNYFTGTNQGIEGVLTFNSGTSTVDTRSILDSLGRPKLAQQKNGPTASTYDTVETDYDGLGRTRRVTMPYSGSLGQTNSAGSAVSTTYDALGRPSTITDGGGGITSYTYTLNDVLVTNAPAPAGENVKRRQIQYDGFGNLRSVCELTSGTGSVTCGHTVPQTGFWTQYEYNLLGKLVTITQNLQGTPQTRNYRYDQLGRLISETNPESGGLGNTYTYDTDATCGTSSGDLVKRVDAAGNVTCHAYDALHRNTAITYPSGPNASMTPERHFVFDSATVNGVVMANAKGRLANAYTGNARTTDLGFSYSPRGEITDAYEATPNSAGYYHVAATYWESGALKTLAPNLVGLPTWTFTPDSQGRANSVGASTGQNPVTSTSYDFFGPTTVTFGSLDFDNFAHDPATGRMTKYVFNVGGSSETANLTWNPNGTLQQLQTTDPFAAANTQTCLNTYDDLVRLINNNCGSVWNEQYSYDAFGNIAKSGSNSFAPTYSAATNRYSTLPAATPTYDADGNLITDGFHTYSYDAEGRHVQMDGGVVTLTYDAMGRWIERNIGTYHIPAVYTPGGEELALMSGQTMLAGYLKLPGGAVARYTSSGLDSYWHSDWLGTPRLYSSLSRTVGAGDVAYGPFGERYVGPSSDTFFTGVAQNVEAADFLHFPARDYHPTQGRWLTPDPAGLAAVDLTNPQSLNRYAYVLNNPLANVDPTGTVTFYVEGTSFAPCDWFSCPGDLTGNDVGDSNYASWFYSSFYGGGGGPGGGGSGPGGGTPSQPQKPSNPQPPPKTGILTTVAQKFCSSIPDARTMTIDVGAGGLGSVHGAVTATLDYKTGLTSFSASGGFLGGWNGALSASFSSGYVYGSSNTNVSTNYSVGSAVSGYYSKSGGSREVGLSVGWGLLGKYSVGAGKYQSTSSVGNIPGLDLPSDQLLELAKQVCQ